MIDSRLSEVCRQNFSVLLNIDQERKLDVQQAFEKALLENCSLRKKNERVYYALNLPARFSNQQMLLLRALARARGHPICRVCLHQEDAEPVHEMLMIHTGPIVVGPLRQHNKTSITYHALDGEAIVKLHDQTGEVTEEMVVSSKSPNHFTCCRLDAGMFRSIQSTSDYFLFLEVALGPFQDSDTIWLNP